MINAFTQKVEIEKKVLSDHHAFAGFPYEVLIKVVKTLKCCFWFCLLLVYLLFNKT